MSKALINGDIIRWARERASLPPEILAARAGQKVERILAWEAGVDRPTFKQAQTLASITHIPFGYLFLEQRPADELALPDLRTVGSGPAGILDANSRDLIRDVMFKHDWFVDALEEQGAEPLPFVGKFTGADANAVAADMRKTLKVSDESKNAPSWEHYLRSLMASAEDIGIWTMRSGIVGSNAHRPLSVKQFRGFAISHPTAPLIFINGQDAKAAQIFTFSHELAHIWIGRSGISNIVIGRADYGTNRSTEILCNKIAAEFLVPAKNFLQMWSDAESNSQNYARLAKFFKVSQIVVARRALDLNKIKERVYTAYFNHEKERWEEDSEGSSGGDFYKTLPVRNGLRFSQMVTAYAVEGRLLYRDAAALLNASPSVIQKYHKRAFGR